MKKRYILTRKEWVKLNSSLRLKPLHEAAYEAFAALWVTAQRLGISVPESLSVPNIANIRNTIESVWAADHSDALKWRAHICDASRVEELEAALDGERQRMNVVLNAKVDLSDALDDTRAALLQKDALLLQIKETLGLRPEVPNDILPESIRALKQSGRTDPTR